MMVDSRPEDTPAADAFLTKNGFDGQNFVLESRKFDSEGKPEKEEEYLLGDIFSQRENLDHDECVPVSPFYVEVTLVAPQ